MTTETKQGKRTPLERKPLHNPGESIQAEMERLLSEELLPIVMLSVSAVMFAAYDWIRWLFNIPLQPIVLTVFALAAIGYSVYKIFTLRTKYRALRLGLEGEKFVGQFLEDLRSKGGRVFHDIVGPGFNIDHVVVSSHGIFVIETKTYSKPLRGSPVVDVYEDKILVNGFEPERNAISQVRALGNWLRTLLMERTGQKYPIQGVVILSGWYVESHVKNKNDVWILNNKALPSFIEHEPIRLKPEDVALISSRLVDYMQDVD